jgi:ADP-Ribosyltransferase in polyvalent proteins
MSGSTFNTLFDPSVVGAPQNTLAPQPTWADAWQFNAEHAQAELERQRAISEQRGLWGPNGPTPTGARDAAQQAAMGVIMGTTAPGARGVPLDNPAFAKWFGNSKVVDEAGQPAVAYHGTADNVAEFRADHPHAKDSGWLGKGFYFWNEPGLAADYATMKAGDAPNVMPVHLKLENPYLATPADKERLMLASRRDPEASAQFTADLQDKGHDGVILNYPHKPGLQEIMVFDPQQVKSAIGNRGTFDPRDPRLTYGIAGLTAGAGAAATQGDSSQ